MLLWEHALRSPMCLHVPLPFSSILALQPRPMLCSRMPLHACLFRHEGLPSSLFAPSCVAFQPLAFFRLSLRRSLALYVSFAFPVRRAIARVPCIFAIPPSFWCVYAPHGLLVERCHCQPLSMQKYANKIFPSGFGLLCAAV